MEALDDFVTRARSENAVHHERHAETVQGLSDTVEQSFGNISEHFKSTFSRVQDLGDVMKADTVKLQDGLKPLTEQICRPLGELREDICATAIREYEPTGQTPEKVQYHYPTALPRTEAHEVLVSELHDAVPTPTRTAAPLIFADLDHPLQLKSEPREPRTSTVSLMSMTDKHPFSMSLREVNPNLTTNLTTGSLLFDPSASTASVNDNTVPLFKRSTSRHQQRGRKGQGSMVSLEGRENVPPPSFSQSLGPRRKSPRLH
jgi:kinesin family protein 11